MSRHHAALPPKAPQMNRSKLLFVTPWEPQPTGGGPAIRAYHSLLALSELYDPHVLVLGHYENSHLAGPPRELRQARWEHVRVRSFLTRRGRSLRILDDLSAALYSRFYEQPSEWRFATAGAIQRAAEAFKGVPFDLVHVHRLFSVPFVQSYLSSDRAPLRTQLDLEQIESYTRWRTASLYEANGNKLRAWRLMHDAEQYRRIEKTELSQWDRLYVSSDLAVDRLRKLTGVGEVEVLPNVIDDFAPDRDSDQTPDPFTFLFVGQLGYYPNADAVRFFIRNVWPHVAQWAGQEVRFDVIGYDASESLIEEVETTPGAQWIGPVEDVRRYYAHADAAVAPIRAGGGTHIKVVEAFAHRVPVVATSIAAEGLDVAAERHLLVADSPLRFAQSCVRLIEKPELRNWLRENASRLYREAYLPKAMRQVLLKSISNY